MQWEFARLLISTFAVGQKTQAHFTADAGTEAAAAIIKQLTGRVNFRVNGLCSLFPLKKLPARPNLRLTGADEEIFTFTAGLCVPIRGCITIEDPPFGTPFDAAVWKKKTAGYAVVGHIDNTVGAAAITRVPVFTVSKENDPLFFAGAMTGALLLRGSTDFVFSACTPRETLGDFTELFTSAGGVLLPLVDGFRVAGKAARLRS
ncbi:MAG: hypothetical protein IJT27_07835 [Clostridia bacterium]|nr:hypothetical protein [Clostridia bacterium]